MNSGAYLITNTKNSKKYVGSSVSLARREKEHVCRLNKQTHVNAHLQNSWNKHGEKSFEFYTLALCAREKKSLLALEQFYINLLRPEYNMAPAAGSRLGATHTKETRAKISAGNKGKKCTDATRAKISAWQKGRKRGPLSVEIKAKISRANKGNHGWNKGIHASEEQRAKMSKAQKGRIFSEEHKAKLSAAAKGKPWTAARRAAQEAKKAPHTKGERYECV